jgi:hypothetical protein
MVGFCLLAMPDIRPLTLTDKNLVADYLHRHQPEISEHTFTNLFIWQPSRPIWLSEIDGSLVFLVQAAIQGKTRYLLFGPPLGDLSFPAIVAELGDQLAGAIRVPKDIAIGFKQTGFAVFEDQDNADYVYTVKDLAELAGRRYAKKRNKIKQCLQNYACEYVPISADLIAECESMQHDWCKSRDCGRNPGLCNEANAIAEVFAHFKDFDLLGGAIRVNGTIQAFAIAEELHVGTAVWHFEKAMADIPGLGQLINQWFAKYGLSSFQFVNREQDLGIPGLRQAKKSYFPHHMVDKYSIAISTAQPFNIPGIKAKGCASEEY